MGGMRVLPLRKKHLCGLMTASRYISSPLSGIIINLCMAFPCIQGSFSLPPKELDYCSFLSKFHRIKGANPNIA